MKNTISIRLTTALLTSALLTNAAAAQVDLSSGHADVNLRASSTTVPAGSSIEFMLDMASGSGAIQPQALTGSFRLMPVGNDWHVVSITHEGGRQYRWTNQAGVSWGLTLDPSGTHFDTGTDNPYYDIYPQFREIPILAGDGRADGFEFLGERYLRPLAERVAGTYKRQPVENDWHTGQLEFVPGRELAMTWRNQAGVAWGATAQSTYYDNGMQMTDTLVTGADNPYPGQHFELVWSGTTVTGFLFQGELYSRDIRSMGGGASLGVDQDGLIYNLYHYDSGRSINYPVSANGPDTRFEGSVRNTWQPVDESGQTLAAGLYWAGMTYAVDNGNGPMVVYTSAYLTIESGFTPDRIAMSRGKTLGNNDLFNGGFYLSAAAEKSASREISAEASASANVTVFGAHVDVFRFEASGALRLDDPSSPATCAGLVRIAGIDYFNFRGDVDSMSIDAPEINFFGFSFPFPVLNVRQVFFLGGFLPVITKVQAGLLTEGGLDLGISSSARQVNMTANVSENLYGSASAEINVLFASAGVEARIDMLKNSIGFPVTVQADAPLRASMTYAFEPVSVALKIFATLFTQRWEETLISWSAGSFNEVVALN